MIGGRERWGNGVEIEVELRTAAIRGQNEICEQRMAGEMGGGWGMRGIWLGVRIFGECGRECTGGGMVSTGSWWGTT